ncbi:hypothetical protein K439DRAFT_1620432 [Ramaria rubella]|nr:hypothetical protein K439DRAFT_1620432 [Ramaria rubella]
MSKQIFSPFITNYALKVGMQSWVRWLLVHRIMHDIAPEYADWPVARKITCNNAREQAWVMALAPAEKPSYHQPLYSLNENSKPFNEYKMAESLPHVLRPHIYKGKYSQILWVLYAYYFTFIIITKSMNIVGANEFQHFTNPNEMALECLIPIHSFLDESQSQSLIYFKYWGHYTSIDLQYEVKYVHAHNNIHVLLRKYLPYNKHLH